MKTTPRDDLNLAHKLARGAVDLHELQNSSYKEDTSDFPKISINMGTNLFFFPHSRGKRLFIALGYVPTVIGAKQFADTITYTSKREASYFGCFQPGCSYIILNPSRTTLFSIAFFLVAIVWAPSLPPDIYAHIQAFLDTLIR